MDWLTILVVLSLMVIFIMFMVPKKTKKDKIDPSIAAVKNTIHSLASSINKQQQDLHKLLSMP
jgi:cell division protein FtsL